MVRSLNHSDDEEASLREERSRQEEGRTWRSELGKGGRRYREEEEEKKKLTRSFAKSHLWSLKTPSITMNSKQAKTFSLSGNTKKKREKFKSKPFSLFNFNFPNSPIFKSTPNSPTNQHIYIYSSSSSSSSQ
ncbi:hypothetical protein QVD17_40749 [Tagetes erecta]|uniref:Uncharacterized protein n=1 Tax=Tagetes erecta TaxID=13708 RepID=A0AAD8NAZ0_TARER|nr:hypothetical protein QVD17_40749 [Tagetes erecta]